MEHGYRWSSKTDVWLTPPDIIERVRVFFQGPPDLDPASSEASNVFIGAGRYINRAQNSLVHPWRSGGQTIWLNPPGGTVRVNDGKTRSVAGLFWARLMEERQRPFDERFKEALFLGFNLEFLRSSQNYGDFPATTFPFVIPRKRIPFWSNDLAPGKSPSHASVIVYVPGQIDRRELFFDTFAPMGAAVNPR